MKTTYPIIIHPQGKEGYHFVEIPDLDGCTQGKNLNECLEMAADYINLCILDYEDRNKPAPKPSPIANIHIDEGNIVILVPIDTILYRQEIALNRSQPPLLNKKS